MAVRPREMSPHRRGTTEIERAEILVWHEAGKSIREIVMRTGKARSTVHDIIKQARERPKNPITNAKRVRRPPKLSETVKRKLVRHTTSNPQDTLAALATLSKSGTRICKSTVRTVLANSGVCTQT